MFHSKPSPYPRVTNYSRVQVFFDSNPPTLATVVHIQVQYDVWISTMELPSGFPTY